MRTLLALLVLSIVPQVTLAAPILGTLELVETNVETFDPSTFTAGPTIDVYHVVLNNPNNEATAVYLAFPGEYVNVGTGTNAFRSRSDLPTLGPNRVAASFIIVPEPIICGICLPTGQLEGSTLAPPGVNPIAVLSVPTGSSAPDLSGFVGRTITEGASQDILFVPEPSTVLLTLFGVAGIATRRRC